MVFQNMGISIFGAQSEMKNVRFVCCLLKLWLFLQNLTMFKLMVERKTEDRYHKIQFLLV